MDNTKDTKSDKHSFSQRLEAFMRQGPMESDEMELRSLAAVLRGSPAFLYYTEFVAEQVFGSSLESIMDIIASVWMAGFIIRSHTGGVDTPHEHIN